MKGERIGRKHEMGAGNEYGGDWEKEKKGGKGGKERRVEGIRRKAMSMEEIGKKRKRVGKGGKKGGRRE